MRINLSEVFAKHEDEHIKFDLTANPLHPRRDICAFLLLDRLIPGLKRPMVSAASHDEIWLDVDVDSLAKVATEDDIVTLIRCGVRYSRGANALAMFV